MKLGDITNTDGGRVEIFRGREWPPGDDERSIGITKSSGWPAEAADTWDWTFRFDFQRGGGDVDLEADVSSATITTDDDGNDKLVLKLKLSSEQTAGLPGNGRSTFKVDLESDDNGVKSTWATGHAIVRDVVGSHD